jgi:hypothetical protein
VKLPARKTFLYLVIASVSVSAILGIVAVLQGGLGGSDSIRSRILLTTVEVDAASALALCCMTTVKSALHRAVRLTGLVTVFAGFALGICFTWRSLPASGIGDVMRRAGAVSAILAVASAQASLLLLSLSYNRLVRIVVLGTIVCTAAAAELIANYALIPGFGPGAGYARAIGATAILDGLGTILTVLLRRFSGSPRVATAADH